MDNSNFADWLQAELDKRGWDALDMSIECYISEPCIKQYLQGKRYPNFYNFLQIIRTLGKRIEIVDDGGSRWTIS